MRSNRRTAWINFVVAWSLAFIPVAAQSQRQLASVVQDYWESDLIQVGTARRLLIRSSLGEHDDKIMLCGAVATSLSRATLRQLMRDVYVEVNGERVFRNITFMSIHDNRDIRSGLYGLEATCFVSDVDFPNTKVVEWGFGLR